VRSQARGLVDDQRSIHAAIVILCPLCVLCG
jgi:hypothetical protein